MLRKITACIILYLVSFYTLPSGQDMLKLRYRVRGMTSQENDRHSPCQQLISTASTLLSIAYNLRYVNVLNVTSIKCYISMYQYHFIHWQVSYHMLVSRYHFIPCLWCIKCYSVLYQSFPQVFPQVVENCCLLADTCKCIICTWQSHRLLPKRTIKSYLYNNNDWYSKRDRKQNYLFLGIYLLCVW